MTNEEAMIQALAAMRFANLKASFGSVPTTGPEIQAQASIYLAAIKRLGEQYAHPRAIQRASEAASLDRESYPAPRQFAELVRAAWRDAHELKMLGEDADGCLVCVMIPKNLKPEKRAAVIEARRKELGIVSQNKALPSGDGRERFAEAANGAARKLTAMPEAKMSPKDLEILRAEQIAKIRQDQEA